MQLLKELQNKTNLEEFKEIIMEKNNNLMSGKGEKGEWKTINGAHVYIEDGQSVEDAMNKQFSKGGGSKASDNDRLKKILSERGQSEDADFAKDTDYFGYGSLDELEKAHNAGYKKAIDQNKARDDRYTTGNPDNINKQSSVADIEKTLKDYKGSGSVDLVLPGGKWAQVRPQKDGTYLVRTNKGSKYVETADEAKKAVAGDFISPEKVKAYATGGGHLSENGGYQGVSNVDSAPKFEYKSTASEYAKGAKFTNPAGVEFEVVDTSTNKQGVEYVKLKDASGEFEIEKAQLDRLGWLSKFSK